MSAPAPCPNCGALNRQGARYCAVCRTLLTAPLAPTLKTCPNCNKPNRIDAHFCAQCGHIFSGSPSPLVSPTGSWWLRARVGGIPLWLLAAVTSALVLGTLVLVGLTLTRLRNESQTAPPATNAAGLLTLTVTPADVSATPVPTSSPTPVPTRTRAPTATALPEPTFDVRAARDRALRATVRIIVPLDGRTDEFVLGSGSVISRRGFILTNNHLFYDDSGRPYNTSFEVLIAFPARNDLGSDAQVQYRAVLVESNARRDLALIRINAGRDGGALPPTLGLDTIPIGDSDAVGHGDSLTILGYPGIGGDSLTLTSGNVSGFMEREGWIKTDAEINQGNSGGPALNSNYELIGVASAASQADDLDLVGKLGLVRPIRFASELIERARRESGE